MSEHGRVVVLRSIPGGGGAQRDDARTGATPSSLDLIFDDANRLVAPLSRSPGASPLALRLPFG